MKAADVFPSKYVRAEDLKGKEVTLAIREVVIEEMENREGETERKPVLYFANAKKGMVLNKTNWGAISSLYGDESDNWTGLEITLYAPMVTAFGETKPALRVKVVGPETEGEPAL